LSYLTAYDKVKDYLKEVIDNKIVVLFNDGMKYY